MKTLRRIFSLVMIAFAGFALVSCDTDKPLDPSTFDEYANEIVELYLEGDEMSVNYLFVNPEQFGFEHYEPKLPVPSTYTDEEYAEMIEKIKANL